jgi:hypothetical protein
VGLDADAWSAFTHDPRDPAHARLRASDADRATAGHLLAEAYAEGRLDLAEHDERADHAGAARLLGDLVPLLDDLVPRLAAPQGRGLVRATPAELRSRAEQEWASDRRQAVLGFLAPSLICWAVYATLSWGQSPAEWQLPWPLIVSVVTFLNVVRVHVSREDIVAAELASLEKKRAKEARALAKENATRERLDPLAVQAASELARRKAMEAARTVEQDVVRRFNERFRP